MGALISSIVSFLTSSAFATAPSQSRIVAHDGFTDCVGVMIAGATEPVTRNLLDWLAPAGDHAPSRVLLGARRASVAQAALIGSAAAHALDYDDYAYSNHVSALLVPAILAEADRSGGNGQQMIDAYLAGYEVWGAVMKREPDHLHSKGWHPTGVFGPIGVAAALSRLRGLSAEQTQHALGLAVANGGGVMDNFATQAKPYQGARAAAAGVECVELALAGLDAGPHALDGSGGLLAALSPRGRADLSSAADWLGRDWLAAKEGINIKLHPTVGASQRTIDAAIQLQRDHAPALADIARVIVRVSEKHAAVMRFHQPADALQAKFSAQFGVAAALLAGRVGLNELTDTFVGREDVQRLIGLTELEVGPDDDPSYPVGAKQDSVALDLADGSRLESEPVRRFKGHAQNPLSKAELKQKFVECTEPSLGATLSEELFGRLQRLDHEESLPTLAL